MIMFNYMNDLFYSDKIEVFITVEFISYFLFYFYLFIVLIVMSPIQFFFLL